MKIVLLLVVLIIGCDAPFGENPERRRHSNAFETTEVWRVHPDGTEELIWKRLDPKEDEK